MRNKNLTTVGKTFCKKKGKDKQVTKQVSKYSKSLKSKFILQMVPRRECGRRQSKIATYDSLWVRYGEQFLIILVGVETAYVNGLNLHFEFRFKGFSSSF